MTESGTGLATTSMRVLCCCSETCALSPWTLNGMPAAQSGPLTGVGSLDVPDLASSAPTGSAMGSHPRPAGRERHGVRFAPRLEKVSEGLSASSTDGSLADSPGTSPPRPARPGRYCCCLHPLKLRRNSIDVIRALFFVNLRY